MKKSQKELSSIVSLFVTILHIFSVFGGCPKTFLKINLVHHAVVVTMSHLALLLSAFPSQKSICICSHFYLSVREANESVCMCEPVHTLSILCIDIKVKR